MAKTFYTDGNSIKNIDFPQYPDSAWDWIEGAPETKDDELFARVAAVFRAANLSADAIANLPFALLDRAGEVYDAGDDWQNKVGFMPNPRELFRLWRLSLFMTNSAYGFAEGNRVIKNLRYIVPTTITPVVDSENGLTGFKRRVGNKSREYALSEKRIVYIWRLDHTTELLPSKNTEFRALMSAAGVLYYADHFVENFFRRGGIKPTMLMVKGVPTQQEREKIENVWDKVVRGWYKYLGKVFNAEAIEPHVIGEGIENLQKSELHSEKLADIAMAAGMPLSLLLANSANYATAQTEYLQWFRNSVVPWANFMADQISDQVFRPLGLKFVFQPEMSDPGQEDEVQRASAFQAYVASGIKPSIAAQIVGVELPAGIEYDDLDPEPEPEPEPTPVQPETEPVIEPQQPTEAKSLDQPEVFIPTIEQVRELDLWRSFAFRAAKRGQPMPLGFETSLPEDIAEAIRAQLASSTDEEAVKAAFDVGESPVSHKSGTDFAMLELAAALNRVASLPAIEVSS